MPYLWDCQSFRVINSDSCGLPVEVSVCLRQPTHIQILSHFSHLNVLLWQVGPGFLLAPTSIEYPTEGGKTAFMNFYAAHNKDYQLPSGQATPLAGENPWQPHIPGPICFQPTLSVLDKPSWES